MFQVLLSLSSCGMIRTKYGMERGKNSPSWLSYLSVFLLFQFSLFFSMVHARSLFSNRFSLSVFFFSSYVKKQRQKQYFIISFILVFPSNQLSSLFLRDVCCCTCFLLLFFFVLVIPFLRNAVRTL